MKVEMLNTVYESNCGEFVGRVTGCEGNWVVELRSEKTRSWVVDSRHATASDACEVLTAILENNGF